GSRWSRMPFPAVSWHGGLSLVAADSPADIWTVAGFASGGNNVHRVLHYDGSTWTEVPFPLGNTPSLLSITGLTMVRGHPWLVGSQGSKAVIQEWDGQAWQE